MDRGLLALPGLFIWLIILLLPWRPWSTRESLVAQPGLVADLTRVTVLIPARNEAQTITRTLQGLKQQGEGFRTIVIDDQSTDDTSGVARYAGLENLIIIPGQPLPTGWSGKLWALEQGLETVDTELVLLLDADIYLEPGTLSALIDKLDNSGLTLVSLMAALRMESFLERLLMPAFIFFFKLLYPFHLSNSASGRVAAAAGGCILVQTQALRSAGAFASLRDCLIDDCALARRIKNQGGSTWIGLTRAAVSQRRYDQLQTICQMVTRTAFTQLRYSWLLLGLCTLLMVLAFASPLLVFAPPLSIHDAVGIAALALMFVSYLPTLRYYSLNAAWACTLPVTGLVYLVMVWISAWQHKLGNGAYWKNRYYPVTRSCNPATGNRS